MGTYRFGEISFAWVGHFHSLRNVWEVFVTFTDVTNKPSLYAEKKVSVHFFLWQVSTSVSQNMSSARVTQEVTQRSYQKSFSEVYWNKYHPGLILVGKVTP